MENRKIGFAVKRLRLKKKKTVEEAAKEIGISQSYLSRIENNSQIPSVKVINKIADYFDVHSSYLFLDEESINSFTEKENELFSSKHININDLEKLNIVHDNGSKITKEEINYVIDRLKELRELRENYLKGKE
ncbi:helix-turn-helix transcriptional regulator [Bacillus sp. FSL R5-0654]|uniref:helix-turn-helix domain-containing protein n=1 Tax=Bacillus TaxID=1386 RepID=UPI0007177AA0|nr:MULTISPECIES: helix-turn-helix transcriptional regulator [Bacillus]KRU14786.1 transcriptional regulator [Bacillus pumilus]MBR0581334.1 helix-turn-helix transcriptional regulator [Bacillus altitudinis A23-8]MCA0162982.1 helix-turn-helix transcriptional regulator [Bacillus sp. RAR_M1_44]MDR7669075.1 helix-turn-helix transcriptional regulator [Bacillus altitudinis]PWN86081.1 XRE family transcriptional regulator [Bacillus altitudinis]